MAILVTGGTGYIGSHTVVDLLNHGYEVVILDNYSNSKPEVLNRIFQITGKRPKFYLADIQDYPRKQYSQYAQRGKNHAILYALQPSVSCIR